MLELVVLVLSVIKAIPVIVPLMSAPIVRPQMSAAEDEKSPRGCQQQSEVRALKCLNDFFMVGMIKVSSSEPWSPWWWSLELAG
jgi:hypothetical protein